MGVMTYTIEERCYCGASISITVPFSSMNQAIRERDAWRTEHRHERGGRPDAAR